MSALSDLFQNIANAIREKTGETGRMKPLDFPSKISTIQGGGGTGGLEAGFYWKNFLVPPLRKRQVLFTFKGDLYFYGSTVAPSSSSKTTYPIYKYVNGEWVFVIQSAFNSEYPPTYAHPIEHNGKVHFMGADRKVHYVWDGAETFTELNVPPGYGYAKCCVSFNGNLYYADKTNNKSVCSDKIKYMISK